MFRTSVILFASFGLLAACATSSANTSNTNPPGDAGKVDYDAGQPGGGGDQAAGGGGDKAGSDVKGRDSTTTRGAAIKPKVVKKVPTTKPPKAEEPAPPPGKKPPRKGRVDPNGLLAESFAIPAATDKVPDFSTLSAPKSLFIAGALDSSATAAPTGFPTSVVAPVGLRFTGSLNVLEAAEYNFCVTSSDGSIVLLEDTPIVDNDGIKKDGPTELCELVSLDPGEYMIELRSFHVTGPVVLRFAWAKGKEATPEVVPLKSLFKPTGADDRVKAGK